MAQRYDLKLTPQEVGAVAVGMRHMADMMDKRGDAEAVAIKAAALTIETKARLLQNVIAASDRYTKVVEKSNHNNHNAKLARQSAWAEYENAVRGVTVGADGVARDADGIPILPFE